MAERVVPLLDQRQIGDSTLRNAAPMLASGVLHDTRQRPLRNLRISVTQTFCHACNRARLSTEGKLYLCLFASRGHDLRALLRGGASDGRADVGHRRGLGTARRRLFGIARHCRSIDPATRRDELYRRLRE